MPFSAGGPLDITGRMIAAKMQQTLGQPIIIENVGGAAGSIGVGRDGCPRRARRLHADYGQLDHACGHPRLLFDLPYDVVNDFELIALLITDGPVLIVARAETCRPAI